MRRDVRKRFDVGARLWDPLRTDDGFSPAAPEAQTTAADKPASVHAESFAHRRTRRDEKTARGMRGAFENAKTFQNPDRVVATQSQKDGRPNSDKGRRVRTDVSPKKTDKRPTGEEKTLMSLVLREIYKSEPWYQSLREGR